MFDYQKQMSDFIYGYQSILPAHWRCGPVIGADTVAQIYRRNFHGGLEQHMRVQFPVTARYVGSGGFRFVLRHMVDQQPPATPLFTVYAANLPGFLLNFDGFEDQHLRQCCGMLAAIDFFSGNASAAGQELPMDLRFYSLYSRVLETTVPAGLDTEAGMYQFPGMHPQTIALESPNQVTLKTAVHEGELVIGAC